MSKKTSDHVFHPPSGSSLPGSPDANPYIHYPPDDIRDLIKTERNEDELAKMKSALKQWERIYVFPGYPYRRVATALRSIAFRLLNAERTPVPRQQTYYNDSQVPEGRGEIMDALKGLYDNYNNIRFDYNRQGERPVRDIDTGKGTDFLSPTEPPIGDSVKERGSGPDPEGMDAVEPPTGGNIDGFPSNIG